MAFLSSCHHFSLVWLKLFFSFVLVSLLLSVFQLLFIQRSETYANIFKLLIAADPEIVKGNTTFDYSRISAVATAVDQCRKK